MVAQEVKGNPSVKDSASGSATAGAAVVSAAAATGLGETADQGS